MFIYISDVTDIRGDLKYWVEFPDKKFKFVHTDEIADKNFAMIAAEYLENHLEISDEAYVSILI